MELNAMMHNIIYAVMMPIALVALCLTLPFYFIYKLMHAIYRYLSKENIKGKVVLITGASSGIGEQLAYEYAKRGACLMIVARRKEQLEAVADRARGLGSPYVLSFCADVSDVADCKRFVDETINYFGRLDHLVNNAGISSVCLLEEATDVTKFAPIMNVNFWGSIYPTFFALPHLKKTGGKIVVNSSTCALLHPPKSSFYTASKASVMSFYEALRTELAPEITITTVTLGFIESEMTRGKYLSKEGSVQVDQDIAKAITKGMPIMNSRACAEAIVDAVQIGKRYVTEPKWYKLLIMLKTLCPEIAEWFYWKIHLSKPT